MRFDFSETDSLKLYQLMGKDFWLKHKQERRRRIVINSSYTALFIGFLVTCYCYKNDWLPYAFIVIKSISEWIKQFYG